MVERTTQRELSTTGERNMLCQAQLRLAEREQSYQERRAKLAGIGNIERRDMESRRLQLERAEIDLRKDELARVVGKFNTTAPADSKL